MTTRPSPPPPSRRGPSGLTGFTIVALGQLFSLLGTGMTGFALSIWAWEITGKATALALVGFLGFAPQVVFSPFAGALVDRWNRKLVMMLADMASGVATVAILVLYLLGLLQMWHIYIAVFFAGTFQSFQFPAFSSAVSLMVKKEQYGRASALIGLSQSIAMVLAPIAAGALIGPIGIGGIMAFDIVSLCLALGALLIVHVPQPESSEAGRQGRGNLLKEAGYGFRYILARPSLLGLQLVFTAGNLLSTIGFTLATPMILARTANDAVTLGSVMSLGGLGAVAGGLLMSVWGGPKRKVQGVLLGWAGSFILGQALFGFGRGFFIWAAAIFAATFLGSAINPCNQAIWQSKVPPDVQGRVFSVRALIAQVAGPLGQLMAGPLADKVFEPAMQAGGSLAPALGGIFGTGPGAGMAVLLAVTGVLGMILALVPFFIPAVRDVETIVPDFDAQVEPATEAASA